MLNLTSKEYPVHTRRSNSDVCTKSKQRRVSTEKWLGVLPKEILMEMNYTQWLTIQHPYCVKVLDAASTKNTLFKLVVLFKCTENQKKQRQLPKTN